MYLLQNAYVAQMVMHMCIICNPLVHLCKSIFFRCVYGVLNILEAEILVERH